MGGNTISKTASTLTKTLPKNTASVLAESKASRQAASSALHTTSSMEQQFSNSNLSRAEIEDRWVEAQATKPVGDGDRRIRLVSVKSPNDDVKYVSKEDYEVMEEWNKMVKEQGEQGKKQVEMEMNEMNQINLEERKEWEKQQLKEEYQTSTDKLESAASERPALTPEQELLMKLSGNSQVAKDLSAEKSDDDMLVSQDKDMDFVSSLQDISNRVKINVVESEEVSIEEYQNVIGKARARPMFEDMHGDSGRVYLAHKNTLDEEREEEILAKNMEQSLSHSFGRMKAVKDMTFPDTFRDLELRNLCDLKRELEFSNTEGSKKDANRLILDFATKHNMKEETLRNILKYVNSVYVYAPTKTGEIESESYGFWNKIK